MKKAVSLAMAFIMLLAIVFSFTGAQAENNAAHLNLTVSANNISYALSNNLYGLSLDGDSYALNSGLVAELVNNNSFEGTDNPTAHWYFSDVECSVSDENGMNGNNTNYLTVDVSGSGTILNTGYTEIYNNKSFQYNSKKAQTADMGFTEDETYVFSAFFKNIDYAGTMTLSLSAEGNTEKYQFNIDNCDEWTKVSLEIKSNVTGDGALNIALEGTGIFYMDSVSLVPKNSYGYGNENWKYISLRQDLVDAIKALSPSFIRFSESVSVNKETNEIYNWTDTVGSLETRKQSVETVSDNFSFVNSNAMGFYECLVLCEELGAVPVPVFDVSSVSAEKAVEITEKTDEKDEQNEQEKTAEALDPTVQKVLDFIEYATGDGKTEWGAKRVADGHSEPFKLQYVALKNDDLRRGGSRFVEEIYNAVGEKYPKIKVILDSDALIYDDALETVWNGAKTHYGDTLVNECYDGKDISLYDNADRYDFYERSGPKVTVDSFSSDAGGIGSVITANNIWSALENTAFLLGLEKNADIVEMASYKTAFSKRNAQAGKRSLIWFDSQDLVLTSDYYAQMLFSNNRGTNYISTDFDMTDEGIYQSATVDTVKKTVYVKLVNTTNKNYKISISLDGFKNVNNPSVQYMTEKFKSAYNDFDEPLHSAPVQADLVLENDTVAYEMGSYSVSVVRIPYSINDGTKLYELPKIDIISPYIHPAVNMIVPLMLFALIFITGVAILVVRIKHHKTVKEEKEQK